MHYARTEGAAKRVNLRFDPDRINDNTTVVGQVLDRLCDGVGYPLPVGLPVKYVTRSLEGAALALNTLDRLDQLPSLEWMKCILVHQCLNEFDGRL